MSDQMQPLQDKMVAMTYDAISSRFDELNEMVMALAKGDEKGEILVSELNEMKEKVKDYLKARLEFNWSPAGFEQSIERVERGKK